MQYRLLESFESLFAGTEYRHRSSRLGDFVAQHLYEDLYTLGRSPKLVARIEAGNRVLNAQNKTVGVNHRRGDGTLGELVPGESPIVDTGFDVARGLIANIELGTELKILAKAMIKQIDRVVGDLSRQAGEFRGGGNNPICVAVVGINHADHYTSYEGDRTYTTDDSATYRHPIHEASSAEQRLLARAAPNFDEFLVLRFRATNEAPFPFSWINQEQTIREYGAILTRVCVEYERRF